LRSKILIRKGGSARLTEMACRLARSAVQAQVILSCSKLEKVALPLFRQPEQHVYAATAFTVPE